MKLQILSDLHLDFGNVEIPRTDADAIVLAGDICLGTLGCLWAQRTFPDQPVIFVLGNHDYYGELFPQLSRQLQRRMEKSNVRVLENSAAELGGYTFLGCTLWSDFSASTTRKFSMRLAREVIADYATNTQSEVGERLMPEDTAAAHRQSLAWLKEQLAQADPKRTIVVTHHAPIVSLEALAPPYHYPASAFMSPLDDLIEQSGLALWVYGHTHCNADRRLGATRILTNQRGYPDEPCAGFNPGLTIEV